MLFKFFADNTNKNSVASKMREKRIQLFKSFLNGRSGTLKMVDIGGTQSYWDSVNIDLSNIQVTLVNLTPEPTTRDNFNSVVASATDLSIFPNDHFDIVYSNSVIEHLFSYADQMKMAGEVNRIGKSHFIQTPYKYFPIEPHYFFPLFQFFPYPVKLFLVKNFSLGHVGKIKEKKLAERQIKEIRLLSMGEMKKLFPKSKIVKEKFAMFTKSLIAVSP